MHSTCSTLWHGMRIPSFRLRWLRCSSKNCFQERPFFYPWLWTHSKSHRVQPVADVSICSLTPLRLLRLLCLLCLIVMCSTSTSLHMQPYLLAWPWQKWQKSVRKQRDATHVKSYQAPDHAAIRSIFFSLFLWVFECWDLVLTCFDNLGISQCQTPWPWYTLEIQAWKESRGPHSVVTGKNCFAVSEAKLKLKDIDLKNHQTEKRPFFSNWPNLILLAIDTELPKTRLTTPDYGSMSCARAAQITGTTHAWSPSGKAPTDRSCFCQKLCRGRRRRQSISVLQCDPTESLSWDRQVDSFESCLRRPQDLNENAPSSRRSEKDICVTSCLIKSWRPFAWILMKSFSPTKLNHV